jgi:hypothetical protein
VNAQETGGGSGKKKKEAIVLLCVQNLKGIKGAKAESNNV